MVGTGASVSLRQEQQGEAASRHNSLVIVFTLVEKHEAVRGPLCVTERRANYEKANPSWTANDPIPKEPRKYGMQVISIRIPASARPHIPDATNLTLGTVTLRRSSFRFFFFFFFFALLTTPEVEGPVGAGNLRMATAMDSVKKQTMNH